MQVAAAVALVSAGAACSGGGSESGGGGGPAPPQSASPSARSAASDFLHSYVLADGRVVRTDQGGDTVSEGQAYGLLLAQEAGDDATFAHIWQWTAAHLQRSDGLFSYHANASGQVLDPQPASDADLLIAWALMRSSGPNATTYHQAGRKVAAAVLAKEVTRLPDGSPVLAAGPWATGRPATLNPGYWSLPALHQLAALTGDSQWTSLESTAVSVIAKITDDGHALPPDWAALTASGALNPEPSPNGGQSQSQYGLDAQRTVVWFAASCDGQARSLAAGWWAALKEPARQRAIALSLNGSVINASTSALPYVAASASASAAGDESASTHLMAQATMQQHSLPTYYGGAWSALGPALLGGGTLSSPSSCSS